MIDSIMLKFPWMRPLNKMRVFYTKSSLLLSAFIHLTFVKYIISLINDSVPDFISPQTTFWKEGDKITKSNIITWIITAAMNFNSVLTVVPSIFIQINLQNNKKQKNTGVIYIKKIKQRNSPACIILIVLVQISWFVL